MTVPTYDELVAARAPALLRLAVMLTGSVDEAEELLQRTFLRAQRHAERIAAMAAPAAYLRQVMLNEHVSSLRLLRRRPRTDGDAGLDALAAPDQHGHDAAPGQEPGIWNCFNIPADRLHHRMVFHTPSGDVRADEAGPCPQALIVTRDGLRLEPALA